MRDGDTSRGKRKSTYANVYCSQVIAFMGQGYSLTAFAGEIGVARSTLTAWIKAHKPFAEAVARGQAARARALETGLLSAETGAKVSARVLALKNAAPEDWRERPEAPAADRAPAASIVLTLPDNQRAPASESGDGEG